MKRKPVGCLGAIGLIAATLVIAVMVTMERDGNAPSQKQRPAVDCTTQDDRKALMERFVARGYWQKVIKPASLYQIHVLPAFVDEVTFDDKQQFVSVVAAYSICEGGDGIVTLVDAMSGENIGTFSNGRLKLD